MINIDQYIVGFVVTNPVTIFLALGALKGLAKLTKSTKDDKIMTMLSNMIQGIKPNKAQSSKLKAQS